MTPTLEDAIVLAAEAHRGQVDKAGRPYILHPLRVMSHLGAQASDEARMAALLHDVVEDTPITMDELRKCGYPPVVLSAVASLTKRDGEDYEAFVRRAGRDVLARVVKIADLHDNMDLTRIASPAEKDLARLEKYRRALALLEAG